MRIPIVLGLGFGDEGKGATVDALAHEALRAGHPTRYVVRFSGGPQAAHNVITDKGEHHTFSQFGSGFFQEAGTILTEDMMVNPFNMVAEAESLIAKTGSNPLANTMIEESALLITPLHVEANRQREINRGIDRHGSCGQGIGETRWLKLNHPDLSMTMGDLLDPLSLYDKLERIHQFYAQEIPGYTVSGLKELVSHYRDAANDIFKHIVLPQHVISDTIRQYQDALIFEGSQGTLLDEVHGFHPHTTWSDVTATNAFKALNKAGVNASKGSVIGALRTYHTRHGDGPFPTEFSDALGEYPEPHNGFGPWQGDFRVGQFDMELAKYAAKAVGGVDHISLSHCDRPMKPVITGYTSGGIEPQKGSYEHGFDRQRRDEISQYVSSITQDKMVEADMSVKDLIELLESEIAPVSVTSYGPKTYDRLILNDVRAS